jgi:hypothetical protein
MGDYVRRCVVGDRCRCGHVGHINGHGLCLAKGCFCLIFRPFTDDGVPSPTDGTTGPTPT